LDLSGAVGGEDDVHGAEGLFEGGGGLEESGIEEGELEGVEFGGDGAGAAEVEDAEFTGLIPGWGSAWKRFRTWI
jgi:hypothetical protein